MKNLKLGFNSIPLVHTAENKYGACCFGVIQIQCEVAQSPKTSEFKEGEIIKVNSSIEGIKFFKKKKYLTSKELRAVVYMLHDLADIDRVKLSAEDADILNEV